MVGCVVTTGGVCLNDEEKGQTGLSEMVRAATNARSRADAALWLLRTPADCYRSPLSLVIWRISVYTSSSSLEPASYCSVLRARPMILQVRRLAQYPMALDCR